MSYTTGMDPIIAAQVAQMTDWMQAAACNNTDYDADLWFPDPQEDTPDEIKAKTLQAKLVCWSCPVRLQCLEYAYTTRLQFGILGGLTPEERRVQRATRTS